LPKITKLTVGRGRTSRSPNQEEWLKEYYELEADVTDITAEDGLEKARVSLEQKLIGWLSEPAATQPAAPQLPKLNMAEIEKLPWKDYQRKQPCRPGDPGWIFTNVEGAQELANLIKASPKEKLVLPPYQFSFSGQEKQFISRKPIKETQK